jgi:transcriptional regulator with XRE-family HTH domain
VKSILDYFNTFWTIIKRNIQIRLDPHSIGRRIREIRGLDLTQVELGKILGITQAQLSKFEKGQRLPTLEVLLKLRAFSGKPIDWIITGEESLPIPMRQRPPRAVESC